MYGSRYANGRELHREASGSVDFDGPRVKIYSRTRTPFCRLSGGHLVTGLRHDRKSVLSMIYECPWYLSHFRMYAASGASQSCVRSRCQTSSARGPRVSPKRFRADDVPESVGFWSRLNRQWTKLKGGTTTLYGQVQSCIRQSFSEFPRDLRSSQGGEFMEGGGRIGRVTGSNPPASM